jgi:hypothetical protein
MSLAEKLTDTNKNNEEMTIRLFEMFGEDFLGSRWAVEQIRKKMEEAIMQNGLLTCPFLSHLVSPYNFHLFPNSTGCTGYIL